MENSKPETEKQKYRIKLPDDDSALRMRCFQIAKDLYGDSLPSFVIDRLTVELDSIRINGFSSHYILASDLVRYSRQNGFHVCYRGMFPSSLVSYFCRISEINPLPAHYLCNECHHIEIVNTGDNNHRICGYDLPDKTCLECGALMSATGVDIMPEVSMGVDFNREPDIILSFAPQIRKLVVEYIVNRFKNEQVFRAGVKVELPDGSTRKAVHPGGIYIVPSGVDISSITQLRESEKNDDLELKITEEDFRKVDKKLKRYDILINQELGLLHDLEFKTGFSRNKIQTNDVDVLSVFLETNNFFMQHFPELYRKAVDEANPQCFSDLARIDGLMHGVHTWIGNGEELIRSGIELKDIISTRDDILSFLVNKGFDKSEAYSIMQNVKIDKGLTQEMIQKMKSAGVPNWYIESCNKIMYVLSLSNCLEYTLVNWKLAYYWLHYPDIYKSIYEKKGKAIK